MANDRVALHVQNRLEVELLGVHSSNHGTFDEIISSSGIDKSTVMNNVKYDPHVVWRHGDYIIKMQKLESRYEDFNEVIHEAAVGSMISKMDNFAEVVAHNFHYISPMDDWYIKRGNRYAYVVYKYIPGVTLAEYILTSSVDQSKDVLWKLINALYIAYKSYGFTHYDLHLANVIVDGEGEPYIIDYGSSHVTIDHLSIGRILKEGTINTYPCWQHDVFKLLMFIYVELQPDLVYETLYRECTRKYDEACRAAFNIRELIYPEWYIEEITDKLLTCKDDDTKNRLIAKLNKMRRKNSNYRRELIEIDKEVAVYDGLIKSMSRDNLPYRPYDLLPSIAELIEWITGEDCTVSWYRDYVKIYKYRQITSKMATTYHEFDLFMNAAEVLLNRSYKK